MRNRSLGFLLGAALVFISASGSSAYGLTPRLAMPTVESYTTMDNLVRVVVSNPASTDQVCTVTVTSVFRGAAVTTSATQSVAAGSSTAVAINAPGLPVSIGVTAGISDSGQPGEGW